MERYQVILAYDGTHFCGFQRQAKRRTVQSTVEAALRQLGWQGRSILAAGRTDTGVHASGQVISFDLDWLHSTEELQNALNANLPPEVAARAVQLTWPDFHPRYDALSRRYRYSLYCQPVRDPLRERYSWRVWPGVAVDVLNQAASSLVGTHDFAAFGSPPRSGGSTIRCVNRAGWQAAAGDLVFEIEANAFLYRMVRRLVFVQVAVAQARSSLEDLRNSLGGLEEGVGEPANSFAAGLAPAQGLTLIEVVYPSEKSLRRRKTDGEKIDLDE